MRTEIQPLYDRVIVKRKEAETKSTGGLFIPDAAKEKPSEGEIIAVGTGRLLEDGRVIPLVTKPGDKVLFGKYAGTDIKVDGEELLMMREEDILALVKESSIITLGG